MFALTVEDSAAGVTPFGEQFRALVDAPGNDLRVLAAFMQGAGWPGCVDIRQPPSAPVLVVKAETDEYMPSVAKLMRLLPQAKLAVIPGTNHVTVIRDPRCREVVASFFLGRTV